MSDDFALNIVGADNFSLSKKKDRRFYGNNNFRHRNSLLKKSHGRSLKRIGSGRIRKLNTSKVQISERKKSDIELLISAAKVEGSTALHFKGVEVLPQFKGIQDKKLKRRSHVKPVRTPVTATIDRSELNQEERANIGRLKGPQKSSLFNQNPDIPKIRQADVSKVREDVFSSNSFADLDIHPHLISCLQEKLNLNKMTAIQQKAVPILLGGHDTLIKSQTGSGKTLAYAVPVVQKLQEIKPEITRKDGPVALVLLPTRELALQSYNLFAKLTLPFCRIVPTWIIGGENRKSEKSRLRKGVNILIGTPGRILDHVQTTESLSLKNLRWVIFDEADRLLDMGFQKQVDAILKASSEQGLHVRQTVLLSATLSERVERLASLALKDPCKVQLTVDQTDGQSVGDEKEENFALPENLTQHVAIVPSKLRLVSLVMFLKDQMSRNASCKIIVFFSCRDSVEFHYHLMRHVLRRPKYHPGLAIPLHVDLDETEMEDIKLFQLHGGLSQTERHNVFNNFMSADSGTLLSTGVASRGLDLPSVDWVVQYTGPGSPVDYIHRAGRTARAGRAGNTLLMLTPAEVKYINLLTQFNIQVHEMTVEDILSCITDVRTSTKKKRQINPKFIDSAKETATSLQNQMEMYVSRNKKVTTLAKTAYSSFIRAYATYPFELKSIFHVKHLHLGHVAKSFALREAPSDIVKNLQKSVGQLPIRSSFEHREAKKEIQATEDVRKTEDQEKTSAEKPRLSRRQIMKNKMARKPDLMSEFSSGLESATFPKRLKKT